MDTAWPGAYYSQVMDSAGALNDIAQRLDDKGWSDLWATLRALHPYFFSFYTLTHKHTAIYLELDEEADEACLYL